MEPIKVEVTVGVNIDLSQGTKDFLLKILERKIEAENERAEKASAPLLQALAAVQSGCTPLTASTQQPAASSTTGENAPAPGGTTAKEPATPVTPAAPTVPSKENEGAESAVSIEDVRKVLAEKVNDHRGAIKNKLDSLGAPSVTKLDPSKYAEMLDFLKSL